MPDAILSVLAAAAPSTTSILLASMGGLINRQGGIVNIGLEPMMLVGAFAAVIVSAQTGNPFLGLLAATASGALLGLVFSWSITRLGANEIVAGLGLNLLVLGFFGYLLPTVFKIEGTYLPPGLVGLPRVNIPLIGQIPGLGPIISGHDVVTYLSWLSVPLVSLFLYRTPLGIQLRATGANEEAARAAGVPTLRLRDFSTVVAGAFAGLAGAQLSLGVVTLFNKTMTGGRGFIALAAFYFGDARPGLTALGAVIFGVFEAARDGKRLIVHAREAHRKGLLDYERPKLPEHSYLGDRDQEPYPGFEERPGEIVIHKRRFSAFFATDLALLFQEQGTERVIIAGVKTNVCIRASVQDAFAYGFRPTIARGSVSSNRPHLHEASLEDIQRYIGEVVELDMAVDWLRNEGPRD